MLDNHISKLYAGWAGYFITIVTKDRLNYFGEISQGEMHYSTAGVVAGILWSDIANCRPNLIRKEFVVMPNHIHGILLVKSLNSEPDEINQGPLVNIETVIRLYKGAVKKYCNIYKLDCNWQSSFHKKTFKTEIEYKNIVKYIGDNIENWSEEPL